MVTFLARTITSPPGTEEQVEASATIVAPATRGIVRVTWTAAMTKLASEYNVEFKILWKSGELDSVPNEGYGQINFQETL